MQKAEPHIHQQQKSFSTLSASFHMSWITSSIKMFDEKYELHHKWLTFQKNILYNAVEILRNDHESSVSMKTICSHLSPLKNSLKTQFGQFYLFIKFFYGHRSSLLLHLIDFLKFIMAIVMSDFVSLVAKFSIIRFSF